MEDHQIRIAIQVFFFLVVLTITLFVGSIEVFLVGSLIAFGMGYAFLPVANLISSAFHFLIFGSGGRDDSYENRSFQTDMDQAKKMVREGRLGEAISLYQKILENVPKRVEVRFELARLYQSAGYSWLALEEYQRITRYSDLLGENHPFILESERQIENIKTVSGKR